MDYTRCPVLSDVASESINGTELEKVDCIWSEGISASSNFEERFSQYNQYCCRIHLRILNLEEEEKEQS